MIKPKMVTSRKKRQLKTQHLDYVTIPKKRSQFLWMARFEALKFTGQPPVVTTSIVPSVSWVHWSLGPSSPSFDRIPKRRPYKVARWGVGWVGWSWLLGWLGLVVVLLLLFCTLLLCTVFSFLLNMILLCYSHSHYSPALFKFTNGETTVL